MITATVRYKLPPHIDTSSGARAAGRRASTSGTPFDARAFYSGPWLAGIVERYGMHPHIEFYEVFALTDNARGTVELFREPRRPAVR